MTRVSIIVPVYKVELYLNRCVDSILAQTLTEFECILVDDGSPDRCGEICDEYAKKDKRIRVIHKENGGLSDARNAGLDIAKGEYIAFVDSDDWIHPQMLEILYLVGKKTQADIISFGFTKVNEYSPQMPLYRINQKVNDFGVYDREYILDNLYGRFQQEINVEVCKKLHKKEIFNNIRFRKGIIHEDDDIFLDVMLQIKTAAVSQIPLYYYYMSPTSIMRSGFSEKEFVRLDIAMRNIRRINEENIVSQKKLCSIPYLQYYMKFYYYIKDGYPELEAHFKKYKDDYLKNIVYMGYNGNLSKAFALLAIIFLVSPKAAKKYYDRLI